MLKSNVIWMTMMSTASGTPRMIHPPDVCLQTSCARRLSINYLARTRQLCCSLAGFLLVQRYKLRLLHACTYNSRLHLTDITVSMALVWAGLPLTILLVLLLLLVVLVLWLLVPDRCCRSALLGPPASLLAPSRPARACWVLVARPTCTQDIEHANWLPISVRAFVDSVQIMCTHEAAQSSGTLYIELPFCKQSRALETPS